MPEKPQFEPWLRDTLRELPSVTRAVLHALELAAEDIERWCGEMTDEQINARPSGLPAVAFHIRHIAGSIDRLLTYAEGRQLSNKQMDELKAESEQGVTRSEVLSQFRQTLEDAARRIRRFEPTQFEGRRSVGRRQLPTTVGGLLVHVADHTQRHVGQAITTAKVVVARQS
jgi:uncharacterized damage-inducible protein DinB